MVKRRSRRRERLVEDTFARRQVGGKLRLLIRQPAGVGHVGAGRSVNRHDEVALRDSLARRLTSLRTPVQSTARRSRPFEVVDPANAHERAHRHSGQVVAGAVGHLHGSRVPEILEMTRAPAHVVRTARTVEAEIAIEGRRQGRE